MTILMTTDDDLSYTLTEADALEIETDARARNESKEPEWTRRKSPNWTDHQTDRIGVLGELVFERVFGWPRDRSTQRHGDSGVDFTVRGSPIATKFNHRRGGYLLVEEYDYKGDRAGSLSDLSQVQTIVLVEGGCTAPLDDCRCHGAAWWNTIATVVGWISVARFYQLAERSDWGFGPKWFVKQGQLTRTFGDGWWAPERQGGSYKRSVLPPWEEIGR